MKVNIVDVGIGNLQSVKNILNRMNIYSRFVCEPESINNDGVILLPGVGPAGEFMNRMKDKKFDIRLKELCGEGVKIIGICLGCQMLFERTDEDGGVDGLNLISGEVKKMNKYNKGHNGWEKIKIETKIFNKSKIRKKIVSGRVFYNHEYGIVCNDKEAKTISIGEGEFNKYSSIIVKNNVVGFQFHPEKSQETGMKILEMVLI